MNKFSTILKGAALLAVGFCCFDASAVNYVADPDPANMVSELSTVTLTFPDADEVDKGSKFESITVTGENLTRSCTLDYGTDANQIVISFSKITEEGTYTIDIPADALTADGTAVEAFSIKYTVGVEHEETVTMIPAPGEVEYLFELTFCDSSLETNLQVDTFNAPEQPYLTSPSGEKSDLAAIYDWQVGNGKYRFRLRKLAAEPGTYTVTFPEKYLYYQDASYNKVYLPAYEFKYEVTGGELTEVISDPSMTEPTNNFNYLNLEFPGYTTVEVNYDLSYTDSSVTVYMEGQKDLVTTILTSNFFAEDNKATFVNSYGDYITPGDYYLTMPAGSFLLGEDKTPCTPFVVNFKVVAPEPVDMEITPAEDSTVSILTSAVISFPEISNVDLARSPRVILYKLDTKEGKETTAHVGGANSQQAFTRLSDNSFRASFSGLATVDGDYRIIVDANSFVFENGYNQKDSVNVKFVAPEAPAFAMTPDGSEALPKI